MDEQMTWGEFKRLVEAEGVTDDSRIRFIDWTDWYNPIVYIKHDGSITVHEGSQRVVYDE